MTKTVKLQLDKEAYEKIQDIACYFKISKEEVIKKAIETMQLYYELKSSKEQGSLLLNKNNQVDELLLV